MVYIGIDIGGTGVKVGVVNEKGEIINRGEIKTRVGRPYQAIVSDIATCFLEVLKNSGYAEEDVESIGIGIPGIADEKTGSVVYCPNMNWENIPLREEIQKYLNKPTFVDNDATVAGYAESVFGVSAGTHSSVFVTLGTGVGGAIILEGKIWRGFHGIGSELGHITMAIGGEPCACGNSGCLERYCSATALIRMGKQKALQHKDSLMWKLCDGDIEQLSAKTVIDAAKELDDAAIDVFNHYVDHLAKAIDVIIGVIDPEVVILGGGVSKAGDFLLNAVRERVPRYLQHKDIPHSRVEIAQLGAQAGIVGAAMLGLQHKI